MLQLHTAPTSNGLRPRIMLEECGLEYALHVVDLQAGEHRKPEFLALNPLGLVPVLISSEGPDDGELVMTQSMNMLIGLSYLSGRFLPKELEMDPLFWRDFWGIGTDLNGTLMAVLTIGREAEPHVPTMDMFGRRLNQYLRVWNRQFAERHYCAGDEVTIADFALYPIMLRCRAVVPQYAEGCPDIDRWFDEMSAREGVRKALDFSVA